jgi:TonB family protein
VVPIDADASGKAQTYALMLSSLGLDPGRASGTLAVFAGNERYDVPFSRVVATGARDSTLDGATPIVVRFPRVLTVDGGYVASLADPDPGACILAYPWMPKNVATALAHPNVANLRKRAEAATVVDAPPAVSEPAPPCAHPYAVATTTKPVTPDTPDLAKQQALSGVVEVLVSLDGSGRVIDVAVWRTSTYPTLDKAAAGAAFASKFAPEVFRCVGVPSSYLFRAEFEAQGRLEHT